QAAHDAGVVHRDLKPANVVLEITPGGAVVAKVLDFGIAKIGRMDEPAPAGGGASGVHLTADAATVGTPLYMSPEQFQGEPADERSDVYALGCVLYEMLTGRPPFLAEARHTLAVKHSLEEPKPPSERVAGLSAAADGVIAPALAKDPGERYQSAEEMDADLARVLEGLPVDPDTETAATAVLSGSGVMAAAPTSVMTRPTVAAPPGTAPPGRTPPAGYYGYEGPPRRRRPVWPWVLSILLLCAAGAAAWFAYTKIQDQLDKNAPVAVPFVKGTKEQLAVQHIREAGLVPQVARSFSDDVEKGTVIEQSPDAGTKVTKNSNVDITVSKGKETVTVPSVIGKSRDDAISTLINAGLDPHAFPVASSRPVDTVTGQDPPNGKVVEKGSRVRINYSSGPAEIEVPSVVGLPFDQASAALQNQGFAVKRVDVDSDRPKGIVVEQSPSDRAQKGSAITLSVSKGPKTSPVPDVTSQDETSARSTLEDSGFVVQVQPQDVTDPGLEGIVLSQNPTGGTKAKQGSTVTIVVGRLVAPGPPPPPIP
ncbi:MAG: PASTA domain-containing protein, partial [Gaiellaceae bacterium]